jgi:hypothetical protein
MGGYRDDKFRPRPKEEDVARTASDVMTGDCECEGEGDTVSTRRSGGRARRRRHDVLR